MATLGNFSFLKFAQRTSYGSLWPWSRAGGAFKVLGARVSNSRASSLSPNCSVMKEKKIYAYLNICWFDSRALASSAPIWQFPGMVPCGDFYKIVTWDFARSGSDCDKNIRMSWKAIENVSSTGMSYCNYEPVMPVSAIIWLKLYSWANAVDMKKASAAW